MRVRGVSIEGSPVDGRVPSLLPKPWPTLPVPWPTLSVLWPKLPVLWPKLPVPWLNEVTLLCDPVADFMLEDLNAAPRPKELPPEDRPSDERER